MRTRQTVTDGVAGAAVPEEPKLHQHGGFYGAEMAACSSNVFSGKIIIPII